MGLALLIAPNPNAFCYTWMREVVSCFRHIFFLVCIFSYILFFVLFTFLFCFSRQSSLGAPESGDYSAKIQLFDGKHDVFSFIGCNIFFEVLLLRVH